MNVTRTTARTASTALVALLATAACATTQAASTPTLDTPAVTSPFAVPSSTTLAAVATTPPQESPTEVPDVPAVPQVPEASAVPEASDAPTETTVPEPPAESEQPVDPTPVAVVDKFLPTKPTTPPTTSPKPNFQIAEVLANPPSTCGVAGTIPGGASNVETMLIDVDADGDVDTVTSYFAAIGDSAGWRLRTDLANGPLDDIAIEGVGPGAARILGPAQVDYTVVDPSTWPEELLVQAGANASGVNLGVFGLDDDGCLFRFQNEMGNDLVLAVHDTIGVLSGLRCDAVSGHRFLVQLQAEHSLGSMYAATETILARSGDALIADGVINSDIDGDVQVDWLNQFGTLHCGSTGL